MRASRRAWVGFGAVALAAVAAGGCDWRDFDTLQNQTPVGKVTAPGGFPSTGDFAGLVLPVAPPADGSVAAWFLTSATESTGVALVSVDPAGDVSAENLQSATFDNLGTNNPLTALAEIPGTNGTAFLGSPTAPAFNNLVTLNLGMRDAEPFLVSSVTASELQLGAGVAAGALAGTTAPDLAAISTSTLHVFVDGSTDAVHDASPAPADIAACPIVLGNVPNSERAHRAMVIGSLLASGPVVAIGVPGANALGTVVFYAVSGDATTGFTVTCAGVLTAPTLPAPTVNSGFGVALAVGDFDGDGLPDLLVGAPPNAVYLYKGPLTVPGSTPTATIPKPPGSAEFGTSLAALNLDGKTGDEALVGDPGATLNDSSAGNVTVYTGPTLAPLIMPPATTPLVLADHDPSAGEGYGSAVGALPFCAAAPCTAATLTSLPVVGAPGAAFTYFTLGATDPRVK
jgi:FG-GAP repeat